MATTTLALGMALFLILVAEEVTCEECQPVCDCTPPCMTADPLNCDKFYFCVDGGLLPDSFSCDPGTYFNPAENACTSDECLESPCVNSAGCQFECGSAQIVADRYDCSLQRDCSTGATTSCGSDNPYFDGKTCQRDESKCCSCRPYCSSLDDNWSVIDMADCTKHYLCLSARTQPTFPSVCDNGEHFDVLSGRCSSTAPCVTLCKNVVGSDGCIDIFTCERTGYFPMCKEKCDRRYYHCMDADINNVVGPQQCLSNEFFHPVSKSCELCAECHFENSSCPP